MIILGDDDMNKKILIIGGIILLLVITTIVCIKIIRDRNKPEEPITRDKMFLNAGNILDTEFEEEKPPCLVHALMGKYSQTMKTIIKYLNQMK